MSTFKNIDQDKIVEMLSYRRPHESWTEMEFVDRFIIDELRQAGALYEVDEFGNIIVDHKTFISKVLFSCHTDTAEIRDGFRNTIMVHEGFVFCQDAPRNEVLGADDGAGVYVLMSMIKAGVPGRYVFHRGEEVGALGSSYIAEERQDILDGIELAVAFDRRGTQDVVNWQLGQEMVEESMVDKLIYALSDEEYVFVPAKGSFTDTAMYKDRVKNCTNISVGYYDEHSKSESLDLVYLDWLVGKVKTIDWQALV